MGAEPVTARAMLRVALVIFIVLMVQQTVMVALRIGGADAAQAERQKAVLDREIKALTDDGAKVELVTPDSASQAAFGANLMDSRVRPAAAKAGLEQGRALAAQLKAVWGA